MERFGPDHVGVLVTVAVLAPLAVLAGRRSASRATALLLAALIVATMVAEPLLHLRAGTLRADHSIPLELCDLAAVATLLALLTRSQWCFECAWFWGMSGALLALLFPPVDERFPELEFLRFFVLHGAIVLGVLHRGPGGGMRPRRGAVGRVFGRTLAFAAIVGVVDLVLGANYFYLRQPPENSPLDLFGPWPWYLPATAALALGLFLLLDLPYRFTSRREDP